MKIKKFIPVLVIFLLSFLITVAAPAYFFFSSEYPKDLSLKISLDLRQGLGFAAFIIIPLWIGTGIESLLARIKDGAKRKMASLIFYLGSFFACIALPILGIVLIYAVFSTGEGWKQLPAPPEKPVAVVAASPKSVVIETEKGNYYYCYVDQLCWQPENKPDSLVIGGADNSTNVTGNMPSVAPPGQVVSMLGIAYSLGPESSESHFAVLDDGTVWYLNHNVNNYAGGFMAGLASIFILPFVAGASILLAGTGISAFARWLAGRIWREPEIV